MRDHVFRSILLILSALLLFSACAKQSEPEEFPADGGKTEENLPGYSDEITSKEIVSFSYTAPEFSVQCELEDGQLHVLSTGGYSSQRDGKYFRLDYVCSDLSLLKTLQEIVEKNDLTRNNGLVSNIAGLPDGLGDRLSIRYESGENVYTSSNESRTVSQEAGEQIYDAFRALAQTQGLDFSTEGSNVQLYDDADEEYLQGVWTGTHFGRTYSAEFEGGRVKIFCDGQLTDDCEYVIFEGCIRKNQLAEGVSEARDEYDYEEFSEISCFRKANAFTLTAYFMKDGYSTDRFLKQD